MAITHLEYRKRMNMPSQNTEEQSRVLLRGTVTAPKYIWGFLVLLKVAPTLLVQVAR